MNLEAITEALPALKESESGRIIFVLSTAAKEPIDGLLISSTLRAGTLGLVKSLSREFAAYGITVNAVLPGYTETPGLKSVVDDEKKAKLLKHIPLNKMALVCDHGALISFLSEARNNYITGQAIAVDGGLLQGI
jgi:3-oxoacyl-[acyl-carrier protein] reductase